MTQELIAKLESASEGSRELEYATKAWLEPRDEYWSLRVAADWTTSIDAALALAERVLPGWLWEVRRNYPAHPLTPPYQAMLSDLDRATGDLAQAVNANTPALAICAAILRASAAEGAGQ